MFVKVSMRGDGGVQDEELSWEGMVFINASERGIDQNTTEPSRTSDLKQEADIAGGWHSAGIIID